MKGPISLSFRVFTAKLLGIRIFRHFTVTTHEIVFQAESHEGREWILSEPCLIQTLEHITALLHSENLWTASNAALVLAR